MQLRAPADELQARDAAHRLGLRVGVTRVPLESLRRFELKARRITDRREQESRKRA
jgi:hypothetical protein